MILYIRSIISQTNIEYLICVYLHIHLFSASSGPAAAPTVPPTVAGNFDLLSQTMTAPNTATVAPFQSNPQPILGMAAPLQQPPLGSAGFSNMSKPVQPVPPMQMMNQQQQQQSMFATNGGINNGMMMGATPGFVGGIQANSAGGSTWSDIKGKLRYLY